MGVAHLFANSRNSPTRPPLLTQPPATITITSSKAHATYANLIFIFIFFHLPPTTMLEREEGKKKKKPYLDPFANWELRF
jgi:hypothetical protein